MNETELFSGFTKARYEYPDLGSAKDQLGRKLSFQNRGKEPHEFVNACIDNFDIKRIVVGFSGGFDSLVTTHWAMNNVKGCEVFHANTGIGIERTREYVRETCKSNGWPLVEIRAKEDCGQDYDEWCKRYGFPGPAAHTYMFTRLKERPIEKLLRDSKERRSDHVMILTGIRKDESLRRSGYDYTTIRARGNLVWCSPFYYKSREWFSAYIKEHNLKQNPVSELLGMSGECLCGAYAHPGELSLVKLACPETYNRIVALEKEVQKVHPNSTWENQRVSKVSKSDAFMPFCVGCEK